MNTLDKDSAGNPRREPSDKKGFRPIGLPALAAAVRRNPSQDQGAEHGDAPSRRSERKPNR